MAKSIADVLSSMAARRADGSLPVVEVHVLGQVRPERDPTVELYVPLPEHGFALVVRHRVAGRPLLDLVPDGAKLCRSCGHVRHLCGCIAFDQQRPDYSTRWDSGPADAPPPKIED